MECQGKNAIIKVSDAGRSKRTRRRDAENRNRSSPVTDGYASDSRRLDLKNGRPASGVASVQDVSTMQLTEIGSDVALDRRHGLTLALKGSRGSTTRTASPIRGESGKKINTTIDLGSHFDLNSNIYAVIEDSLKKKRKHHSRRHNEEAGGNTDQYVSPEREALRGRKTHHRHYRDSSQPEHSQQKELSVPVTQITEALVESLAKLCAQMNENSRVVDKSVTRTTSHKSLQCLVPPSPHAPRDRAPSPARLSPASRVRSNVTLAHEERKSEKQCYCSQETKYTSKSDLRPRGRDEYEALDPRRSRMIVHKEPSRRNLTEYGYRERDYDSSRLYESDKRPCEPKTSRSFDVDRDRYADESARKTHRSDQDKYEYQRRKRHEDRKFEDKLYEERHDHYKDKEHYKEKERIKRVIDYDRMSVVTRDDDFRDRLSERERDSGLSVADGASSVSGKSNYLRFVKLEIAQQRESMDKMMKLWKDLMKCFKGISQPQDQNVKNANETANQARDNAASQLRLWRECMQRYETVARDVGDTDTRLMEEINKQRSEMAEMATMWQECLQRYRDMSDEFNDLKQKLDKPESPPHPAVTSQVFADGEHAPYRLPPPPPPGYPPAPPHPHPPAQLPPPQLYMGCGSPLRTRASAPPPWSWWEGQAPPGGPARPPPHPARPRRQSSLDSRGSPHSRDRRRRSRSRPRDRRKEKESNKEKTSKSNATRSEHRSRKR